MPYQDIHPVKHVHTSVHMLCSRVAMASRSSTSTNRSCPKTKHKVSNTKTSLARSSKQGLERSDKIARRLSPLRTQSISRFHQMSLFFYTSHLSQTHTTLQPQPTFHLEALRNHTKSTLRAPVKIVSSPVQGEEIVDLALLNLIESCGGADRVGHDCKLRDTHYMCGYIALHV